MTTRRIGIFGGSFNPVHIGHLIIADFIRQQSHLDEVWLMLSPLNPLKNEEGLASDKDRLAMLRIATRNMQSIKPSEVECQLPRPSFTAVTLRELSCRFSDCIFSLIIGSDNWNIFNRWREYKFILDNYEILVYPRPDAPPIANPLEGNVRIIDAPVLGLSSTFIRKSITEGLDVNLLLPSGVYDYIKLNKLYLQ